VLSGIGFATEVTAAVTAALIESTRRGLRGDEQRGLAAGLEEIGARLTAIEAAVRTERRDRPSP
jgi:hypothetical protein